MRSLPCLVLLLVFLPAAIGDESTNSVLTNRAAKILERNCLHCHRGDGSASRAKFDVRSVESMLDAGVIVPGERDQSLVWSLAHRGTMPPRSHGQLSRLTPSDGKTIADWIQAGAPRFSSPEARTSISMESTMKAIVADLKGLPDTRTRSRQRYFSLVESHDNSSVSDEALKLTRAALSKTLNSLSWERDLALVRTVDEHQTLFAVDIEQLGWTRDHWRAVRNRYPYAIGFANLPDSTLRSLEEEILHLTDRTEPLFMVRADWFVSTALQPSLYHALLYDLTLPELTQRQPDASQPSNSQQMTAADLERFLQVDVIANMQRGGDHAMRGGFTSSGVSGQNRVIERHRTKFGAYWKSYDFKADNRRSILSQFPLGPSFPGHPEPQLVFEHDGGEIIFNLPNGLQAYLLIDGNDRRIDAGPIDVVSDALKTSGTPAIVTGVSCFACHKQGMINPPPDEIREYARVFGKARDHVDRLYSPSKDLEDMIEKDTMLFTKSLTAAIGPMLRTGDDSNRPIEDFPEPVFEVTRSYLHDELDLQSVAAELHQPDVNKLRAKIEADDVLQRLGLAVLLRADGRIKRAFWEGTQQGGPSVMQITAFAMDFTTPQFSE